MNKDEALEMAIETLEMAYELEMTGLVNFEKYKLNENADIAKKMKLTIKKCKEALYG